MSVTLDPKKSIRIRGARTHNLKNIDVDLPRDELVVITGLSGSGKSSLAFDTLYAEGQRRYVESLSAYARQFLSMMNKPEVDTIEGLSPAIAIQQKSVSHNPRSTVGTITEIYDYLRLLYARVGTPQCPKHHKPLDAQTITQMTDTVMGIADDIRICITAPIIRNRKGEHIKLFDQLQSQGFLRVIIDGEMHDLDEPPTLNLHDKHTIEVVIDRLKMNAEHRQRINEGLETATDMAEGLAYVRALDKTELDILHTFSAKFACPECGYNIQELEPRLFSFNNPVGACKDCDGLGVTRLATPDRVIHDDSISIYNGAVRGWDHRQTFFYDQMQTLAEHYGFDLKTPFKDLPENIQHIVLYGSGKDKLTFTYMGRRGTKTKKRPFEGIINTMMRRYNETESDSVRDELIKYFEYSPCPSCEGSRLCTAARHVWVGKKTLPEVAGLSTKEAHDWFESLNLKGQQAVIAEKILKEIVERLFFLVSVGLNYLTLDRQAETLSGGEAQRIRLASQIGSGLVGVSYILDEPSIGLHQRDNTRLLDTLKRLRDLGNTVVVVEHDEDAIRQADYVVDIGPGAGVDGGHVMACGKPADIEACKDSITGQYLSGAKAIAVPKKRLPIDEEKLLSIMGATANNLQDVEVHLPVGLMTCITGVSGSGKSSLINDTLHPLAAYRLNGARRPANQKYRDIKGLDHFDKVVAIDQSPIGRTPRSNPATYTGLFTNIRDMFTATPEARARGYAPGRFSFNVKGGRCEHCEGDGIIRVEMHFLSDVYVMCDECRGSRYNRETLDVRFKGKNIGQVLNMTVAEGREFFDAIPSIANKLQTLMDVGLGYIKLGQSATTLSGGEAQRIKLAKELARRATGRTLYILDEPTTGLHFHDIQQLLNVLLKLRDQGNTLVIIEHNLDVIKTADWLIDLGPEGGSGGGKIIATGTPEDVAKRKGSFTGEFLKGMLG